MILPALLAQAAPRDLTPPSALGGHMFYEKYDPLEGTGLASLKKHLLPPDDVEVCYWGGFAWGTQAFVLRRRAGKWSAIRFIEGSRHRPTPLPAPKVGWPAFWAKAERLGIFTLPDQEQAGSKKGYHTIFDGYSTLVEYQHQGVYRAYAYNNPNNRPDWPPARPMAALDRFITSQFPR